MRNGFVSPLWTAEQLEMIADARRVLGYAGTFVPHEGFVDKILSSRSLEEAMELRPKQNKEVAERMKGEAVVESTSMSAQYTLSAASLSNLK